MQHVFDQDKDNQGDGAGDCRCRNNHVKSSIDKI
jgi:hypothetical protein